MDDPSDQDSKSESNGKPTSQDLQVANVNATLTKDDFAMFPEWDILPLSMIINPRVKRSK